MAETKQSMEQLMKQIREITAKQKSQNKGDEVAVAQALLNDPDFQVGIYDKNKGYIGTRNVHEEAVNFVAGITSDITGLDKKTAEELASNYTFTKKDANFIINTSRDFVQTYLNTGRKFNILQSENAEANIFLKPIPAKEKMVPTKEGAKLVKTGAYNKVACKSGCPKYNISK